MDPMAIRQESISEIKKLGMEVGSVLPLLDGDMVGRSIREIGNRVVCLNGVAAAAYGFSKAISLAWITSEVGREALSNAELSYLTRQPDREHH